MPAPISQNIRLWKLEIGSRSSRGPDCTIVEVCADPLTAAVTLIVSSPFLLCPACVDLFPYLFLRNRMHGDRRRGRTQRILDRGNHASRGGDGAAFAGALDADRIAQRRRLDVMDLDV